MPTPPPPPPPHLLLFPSLSFLFFMLLFLHFPPLPLSFFFHPSIFLLGFRLQLNQQTVVDSLIVLVLLHVSADKVFPLKLDLYWCSLGYFEFKTSSSHVTCLPLYFVFAPNLQHLLSLPASFPHFLFQFLPSDLDSKKLKSDLRSDFVSGTGQEGHGRIKSNTLNHLQTYWDRIAFFCRQTLTLDLSSINLINDKTSHFILLLLNFQTAKTWCIDYSCHTFIEMFIFFVI